MESPDFSEQVFQKGMYQKIQFVVSNMTKCGHINIILMSFHLGPCLFGKQLYLQNVKCF